MQFFDLNIPYLESDKNIPDKRTTKDVRLKTMARAVELGYSGIAFNHTIKAAMSQSDGCTIPRFPLSSLLKLHASLSAGASFHRRLLGVPDNTAFRQYTRLTVVVDSDAQSSALNSGNPVLKTYDLVAVRPLNQTLFDHACTSAQVDMISIDFGKKLPFRLKLASVKAAIERGVYFEIMYSSFLEDSQVRRQLISNAKLLVEWTRGKNVIVSSAAPSFHELRGPNDVSNLLYLLGMSNERAKAAISKNCRSLIASALRKKQFYKEAIKVELMPAGAPTNPKDPWIIDHANWDPLSSGEGDLLLEDLAKSFAESGKTTQTVKSIDFTSLIDTVSSHDKQGGDTDFRIAGKFCPSGNVEDIVSSSNDLEEPKGTWNKTAPLNLEQAMCLSTPDTPKVEEFSISPENMIEELNMSDALETTLSPVRLDETSLHDCAAIPVEDMVVDENIRGTVPGNASLNIECDYISRNKIPVASESFDHNAMQADTGQLGSGAFNKSEIGDSLEMQFCVDSHLENHLLQLKPDLVADAGSMGKMDVVDSFVLKDNADGLVSGDVQPLNESANEPERNDIRADDIMSVDCSVERNNSNGSVLGHSPCVEDVTKDHDQYKEHHSEVKADSEESQLSNIMIEESFNQKKDDTDSLIEKSMVAEELMRDTGKQVHGFVEAEHQCLPERKSGNLKVKRSASSRVIRFPFMRFLQLPFKRKGRTSMYKTNNR
ncbi:hypothetical protein RND81_05G271500 [Saponaria officinalis]